MLRTIFNSVFAVALVGSLSLGVSAQAATPSVHPRVIGGADVPVGDFPWQVLFIVDNAAVCGGAVVTPTKVVSAAHCFAGFPTSSVQAWAGISELSARSASSQLAIESIAIHPVYNSSTYANDIAVVTLSKSVPEGLGIVTLGLPSGVDPATWPASGTAASISGWGEAESNSDVASNQLQAVGVEVLAGPESVNCGSYGSVYMNSVQICAGDIEGGVDACQGDSGGALVAFVNGEPVMAGVASTGFECAAAGYPGLYVRVTSFLGWLSEQGINPNQGGRAIVKTPGTDSEGVVASFRVGQTYSRAVFAEFTGLSTSKSRLKVTGGVACVQVKQSVRIDRDGKCRLLISQGKKRIPIIVTIYSS